MKMSTVTPVDRSLEAELRLRLGQKTKPPGSLGRLEELALQAGLVQGTGSPVVTHPLMLVFAGDHGITAEGVSPYPQEVTRQMVLNFLAGGAAINVLCRQGGIDLRVVNSGVAGELQPHEGLISACVGAGTRNFLREPALEEAETVNCLLAGAHILDRLHREEGSNVIGFGEMGIGNTSSAACLMAVLCGIPVAECVGRGTGLDDEGLRRKTAVLERALARTAGRVLTSVEALQEYGGFEIAQMCGAMLKAAELRLLVVVDGFISTAAALVASRIAPELADYCVFAHRSDERGHQRLLEHMKARPLLDLDMRLGEGTGAALAIPLVRAAVALLNDMSSFESAGVSDRP